MEIRIDVDLSYAAQQPCDLLLQVEVASLPKQLVKNSKLQILPDQLFSRIAGSDHLGQRVWLHANESFECRYSADVTVSRRPTALKELAASPLTNLDGSVVDYLMPSRYCHPDDFSSFIEETFPGLGGGELIETASAWIEEKFHYDSAVSDARTTASDSLSSRRGVCRDYAHVLIALARAATIPARLASVYSPYASPPDFHAVAEVYLAGDWHLVDATGMAEPESMAIIGVGRDAAEVSFLTAYGTLQMQHQIVKVARIRDS